MSAAAGNHAEELRKKLPGTAGIAFSKRNTDLKEIRKGGNFLLMIPDRKREIKKPHLFVTKRRSRNHNLRCTTLFGTVQANRTNQTCRNNARRTLTLTETGFGIRAHGLLHALYCCRLAPDDGSLQAGDRATPSVHSLCSYMDMIHFFSRKVKRKSRISTKINFLLLDIGTLSQRVPPAGRFATRSTPFRLILLCLTLLPRLPPHTTLTRRLGVVAY